MKSPAIITFGQLNINFTFTFNFIMDMSKLKK